MVSRKLADPEDKLPASRDRRLACFVGLELVSRLTLYGWG